MTDASNLLEAKGEDGTISLYLTKPAHLRLTNLINARGTRDIFLKIQVDAGGCAGFTYRLDLVEKQDDGSVILTCAGVHLMLDAASLDLLQGSTLDFATSLMGEAFTLKNPAATASCGCGSSFSIF